MSNNLGNIPVAGGPLDNLEQELRTDLQAKIITWNGQEKLLTTVLNEIYGEATGKVNLVLADTVPATTVKNTQYWVKTYNGTTLENGRFIIVTDSLNNATYVGTTDTDLDGYVKKITKVGNNTLSSDVTPQMLFDDTKNLIGTFTNKNISADNNNITDIEVDNFKAGVVQTSLPETPTDTQLLTAKAINDSKQDKLENDTAYTTPTDSDSLCNVSLLQNKVKRITFANLWTWILNKISGICEKGLQISSGKLGHTNSITAQTGGIYNGNIDAQGHFTGTPTKMTYSGVYTSAGTNSLFTRTGAYNMYTALNNAKQNKAWTYVGILGAGTGSTITVKDDWTELLFVMRLSEGSNVYNVNNTVQKEAFTQGGPTNNTTFIGFTWNSSYYVAMRVSLRNTGDSRNVRVDYTTQNGWNNNGVYVLKR